MESRDSGVESRDLGMESRDSGMESRDSDMESRDSGMESRDSGMESRDSGMESRDSGMESRDSGMESRDSGMESRYSLDVDVGISRGDEPVGDKVVLHAGVDLDDVAPLAPHVQVVDGHSLELLRARADGKRVTPGTRERERV